MGACTEVVQTEQRVFLRSCGTTGRPHLQQFSGSDADASCSWNAHFEVQGSWDQRGRKTLKRLL